MTPRTRLIVVTNAHNPSGVVAAGADLDEIGRYRRGLWRARAGG